MAENSQKFIGRNRAPRVQIEYEVEHYGAKTKIQLPFVMGVLADLSGKLQTDEKGNEVPLPAVAERKLQAISVDNFSEVLKSLKPRVSFSVDNKLTGAADQQLGIDITFTSLDDFTPGKLVEKLPELKKLLEERRKLETLIRYMDGRSGAEALITQAVNNSPQPSEE